MEILQLSKETQSNGAAVGGKAANLLQLLQLGTPVPGGIIITTAAYDSHAKRCLLRESLSPLIEKKDWESAEQTALAVFTSITVDDDLVTELCRRFRQMGVPAVAVRSSATCEDQMDASFAGQYETFLNVKGEPELVRAVQQCWASLWSLRALTYRHERSIDHFSAGMAVIIQEMLVPDAAGVIFTVDPMTLQGNSIRVEAVAGLGEAIVSGAAVGEVYHVDRSDLSRTDGVGHRGLLTPGLLERLCALALQVERHFGCPQDIEFAVVQGNVHLLQARAITSSRRSLAEALQPPGKPSFLDRMMKPFVDERYATPPLPLDNIIFTRLLGAHIYTLKECGGVVAPEDHAAFDAQIWRQAYRLPRVRGLWRAFLGDSYYQFRQLRKDWQTWWDSGPRDTLLTISEPVEVSTMGDEELLARADRILAAWEEPLYKRISAAIAIRADSWLKLLVTVAVGFRKRDRVMASLMTGLDNPTFRLNQELWDLSRLARKDPEVLGAIREMVPERLETTAAGKEFLEAFNSFIHKYGHREGSCWYLTTPTWRQDPTQVWRLLRSLAEADQRAGDPEEVRALRLADLAMIERRLRLIPGLLGLFHWILNRLCALHTFRENSHFDLTRPLDALQGIAAEWGRRLQARGLLKSQNDVGYLTYPEVRAWLLGKHPSREEVQMLLAQRRATYQVVNARWQAERFGGMAQSDRLKGIAASPGVAHGKARLIRGQYEFDRLQPNDVLVSPYTNPAWTPLFATAAAVVVETGGVSSHAAIVAREYGIPAVMAVPGVTRILRDGEGVLVDGNRGIVCRTGA